MYYYKTTIQYEGTHYSGFQWQTGIPTIQSEINEAISKLHHGKATTTAASRTDTGVHALEQIVKISCIHPIDYPSFLIGLNTVLPPQIRCLKIEPCAGLFRPATEAITKEYRYFFTNKKQTLIADRQFIGNIANELDFDSMVTCTKALLGVHDFCNFYSSGSNVKSTVRNISVCHLSVINPHEIFSGQDLFQIPNNLDQCYEFRIEGNGFLKQMIRHIISSLWMVGGGRVSTDEFMALLKGPKVEKHKWKVASPRGLFLWRINYP